MFPPARSVYTNSNCLCYNSFTGQGQLPWCVVCLKHSSWTSVGSVSFNRGTRFREVETGDTGASIEPEESHYIRGFPIEVRKQVGDVVQLVRTLP